MGLWDIIEIISWIYSWRFSVCLLASLVVAAVAIELIPIEPLRWAVAAAILFTGIVVGWRWDSARLKKL